MSSALHYTYALANGASNPSVFTALANARALGRHPTIDGRRLPEVEAHFTAIAKQHGFPIGQPQDFDPIAFLKARSFDGHGREMLAILQAVFRAPYATLVRSRTWSFVWPVFPPVPDPTDTPAVADTLVAPTATTRTRPGCARASSTSTRACRSGATAT